MQIHVLIIDDNSMDREFCRRALQRSAFHQYVFSEAANAERGLELFLEEEPDVVLLDYQLPTNDGLWFLRELAGMSSLDVLPVVMLTGMGDEAIVIEAIQQGAQDYLCKDTLTRQLVQITVMKVIERAHLARQLQAQHEELEQARRAAEQASRTKSAFLANMSHEMRTPLTSILGFAENLLLEDAEVEERESSLRTVLKNGQHLLELINDILDVSKIEAGQLEVEQVEVDLLDLLTGVLELMEPRLREKNLEFQIDSLVDLPVRIETDPLRLRQILINLLSNAIKFSDKGVILVLVNFDESKDGDPELEVSVFDSGIGMTPDRVETVFQPFTQASADTSRKFGGTGLGLTITRRLVEKLGGEVVGWSRPGLGSAFRFTIRCRALTEVRKGLDTGQLRKKSPHMTITSEEKPQKLVGRILVVEDGIDNQTLVRFILERAGAEVELAENGQVGIEAVRSAIEADNPFDVILMDLQMPEVDGYEATRRLRAESITTPIIALTANAMEADRQRCLDVGCDGYATKPIERVRLLSMIQHYLTLDRATEAT